MKHPDRRWHILSFTMLGCGLASLLLWFYSWLYGTSLTVPRAQCNEETELRIRGFQSARPDLALLPVHRFTMHSLQYGEFAFGFEWFAFGEKPPRWIHHEPIRWSNLNWIRRSVGKVEYPGGAIQIPVWPFIYVFFAAAPPLWYFAPTRRAARRARRDGVRVERRWATPRNRKIFAAIAGVALLLVTPFALVYLLRLTLGDFEPANVMPEQLALAAFVTVWATVPVIGAILIGRAVRWRRARIDRPECIHCRYNLTGNESGKCPECGNPIHPRQIEWLAGHARDSNASRPVA